jgi:hypothetical protein
MRHPDLLRVCVGAALVALVHASLAQPPAVPRPPRSARAGAQVDLTGNWVAQITEDWRWRMITPPKGDYASVPLNAEGRQAADRWDLASDDGAGEQCRAYGAGGIMRQPTRLKITWADEDTLRLETDAGEQIRLFHFAGKAPADTTPSWQGWSAAEWTVRAGFDPLAFLVAPTREATSARAGGAGPPAAVRAPPGPPPPPQGGLKVVTTRLRPGYLRKNGVPYSGEAVVTEYYDRLSMFGNDYLQVVTVVTDPVYLTTPFTVSNQFKREPDGSKWHPTPCATDPPLGTFHPPANPL